MSGFLSALWMFGIGSANPRISADAGLAVVGIAGPASALPALAGDGLLLAALPVHTRDCATFFASPVLAGSSAKKAASPALTGVIYG